MFGHLILLLIALQDDISEESSWWTQLFGEGEMAGKDWLMFMIGVLFSGVVSYGIYSAMLYNQIGANRHPANLRKLMFSLALLLIISCFAYAFSTAFGGLMVGLLLVVWLALVLIFFFTRRKALPQS